MAIVTRKAGSMELVADLLALAEDAVVDPFGGEYPAIYDTAQLVVLADNRPDRLPGNLLNHALEFLLNSQNRDGSWGSPWWPREFRVVSTLAAANAMAAGHDGLVAGPGAERLKAALAFLTQNPTHLTVSAQPDVMAVEYILPDLLEKLVARLTSGDPTLHDREVKILSQALAANSGELRRLGDLREAARRGRPLPIHIAHSLELLNDPGPYLEKLVTGLPAGCSAAATVAYAAWSSNRNSPAIRLLQNQTERLDGGLPVIMAMNSFEILWILGSLSRTGLVLSPKSIDRWTLWIREALTQEGVKAGAGLPPDGDDTAVATFLLLAWGKDVSIDPLLGFVHDAGCASYPGERTTSTTTAAHALEALGMWAARNPENRKAVCDACDHLVSYLLDSQHPDGTWSDKWHASPLYATFCCASALDRFGGREATGKVQRSIEWILGTQRQNGSWGQWVGTLDETACALLTLPNSSDDIRIRRSIAHGLAFLAKFSETYPGHPARTPMWQGKELYEPHRIVRASILSARCRHRGVGAQLDESSM